MAISKSLEAVLTSVVILSMENKFEVKNIKSYEPYEGADLVEGRKYCLPKGQYVHKEIFKGIEYGAYYTVDSSGRKGKISAKSFNKTHHDVSCKVLQAESSKFVSSTGNRYWCPVTKGKVVKLWSGEFPVGLVKEDGDSAFLTQDLFFEVCSPVEVRVPQEAKGRFVWADEKAKTVKTEKVKKLTYKVITKEEFLKK